MMKKFLSYCNLILSFHFIVSNPARSRGFLNRAIHELSAEVDFVEAFDARLMVIEDRDAEARERFANIIRKYSDSSDSNRIYIKKYCEFFIALYNRDKDAFLIRSQAIAMNTNSNVKRFLPFFSEEAIRQVLDYGESALD